MRGFENLSGMESANQMFTSCGSLETIYATSFSNSGLSGSREASVNNNSNFLELSIGGAALRQLGLYRWARENW